jgi:hypothetical protein
LKKLSDLKLSSLRPWLSPRRGVDPGFRSRISPEGVR